MVEFTIKEKKEKWYKSRRIQGAILTVVSLISITIVPENYVIIGYMAGAIASSLGLASWKFPKK